jgi:hypothetical protein
MDLYEIYYTFIDQYLTRNGIVYEICKNVDRYNSASYNQIGDEFFYEFDLGFSEYKNLHKAFKRREGLSS